jgi:hypothetical protein
MDSLTQQIGQELKKRSRLKTLMAWWGLQEIRKDAKDGRKNLRRHVNDLYKPDPFTAEAEANDDDEGDEDVGNVNLGDFNFHGVDSDRVEQTLRKILGESKDGNPTIPLKTSSFWRNAAIAGALAGSIGLGWIASSLIPSKPAPMAPIEGAAFQPSGKFRVQWEQAEDGTYTYKIVPMEE